MPATLTWLDLTASDRDKMRRVLDLFNEQGTLDEMGLGNLRDTLSDALFPGTSYIQTRLRYVFFIPWLYQRLETRRVRSVDIAQAARQAEIELIGPLERSVDNNGIIGVRARHTLVRLPSSIYWNALTRWDIFRPQQSQGWFHTNFDDLVDARSSAGRTDDPGVTWRREAHWHPRMPEPPADFPWEASFALTPGEADFLLGRLEERCAGSLLGWLARNGTDSSAEDFWNDPDVLRAPQSIRDVVELARRFSLHVEGMPLLYNLLVAERRRDVLDLNEDESIDEFRNEFVDWAKEEANELHPFAPEVLWDLSLRRSGRISHSQRMFIESWSQRIAELCPDEVADDRLLRSLINERERQLKGARARLVSRNRLMEWRPGVGVGRMDFRWVRVRQFLTDLHRGLAA